MAFYRSYQNPPDTTTYSYTGSFIDQPPVKTSAWVINNVSFNCPVIIGNQVVNCYEMLRNCESFNQDIHIPLQVSDCSYMLADCPSFGANIYYHNGSIVTAMCNRLLYNKNTSKRVNIYFSGSYPSAAILNTLTATNLTWTTGEGYKYNIAQNIYLYNNYPM